MSRVTGRFMRLLVFYDLPVTTKAYKRAYVVFRRFLLNEGYTMLQWSVYSRIVAGRDGADKHIRRLERNLPREGSVRCLMVSEKQFASMRLLVGDLSFQEKRVTAEQMLLF